MAIPGTGNLTVSKVSRGGGQIKLLSPTRRVQDLLQISKLDTVFEVYDDEAEAIRSFN